MKTCLAAVFLACLATSALAQHAHHMSMDADGMVMNENTEHLPRGCSEISRDYDITVRAGRSYAEKVPGMVFGMSQHEVRVEPCSRLSVTFINEDEVRHQWMVHGLPAYLYPQGMFHMEASAGVRQLGRFIVPADDRTYLVHCDMAQHMEKGMKGQLVVGRGSGNLWSVKGIGKAYTRAWYLPSKFSIFVVAAIALGAIVSIIAVRSD